MYVELRLDELSLLWNGLACHIYINLEQNAFYHMYLSNNYLHSFRQLIHFMSLNWIYLVRDIVGGHFLQWYIA